MTTAGSGRPAGACPRCGATTIATPRPAATVVLGRVEVVLPARSVPTCVRDHRDGERSAVRAALSGLVRARSRAFGDARCGACRCRLDLPERTTGRAVTVEPEGAPPYTVELRLPLVRCPDCAVDNLPVGVATLLRRATAAALR